MKRLFSIFFVQFAVCLFVFNYYSAKHNTRFPPPEKVKFFLAFLNQFLTLFVSDEIDNKPCSSERAETRVSDEMFSLFFG